MPDIGCAVRYDPLLLQKRIPMQSISHILATELHARPEQIEAAVRLLDEGATVPFIARYRKEITGGLDDTQLRNLEQRLGYLRELRATSGHPACYRRTG